MLPTSFPTTAAPTPEATFSPTAALGLWGEFQIEGMDADAAAADEAVFADALRSLAGLDADAPANLIFDDAARRRGLLDAAPSFDDAAQRRRLQAAATAL